MRYVSAASFGMCALICLIAMGAKPLSVSVELDHFCNGDFLPDQTQFRSNFFSSDSFCGPWWDIPLNAPSYTVTFSNRGGTRAWQIVDDTPGRWVVESRSGDTWIMFDGIPDVTAHVQQSLGVTSLVGVWIEVE